MFRPFLSLLFAIAIAVPKTARADDMNEVVTHLRAVSSMTANFVQTDRNGKRLTGVLTLRRPGKIRFQYQAGIPLLIVGDGKALTFIDYSVKQVSRWPISNSPLSFLINPSKDIASIARVTTTRNQRVVVIEARDPRRPEFGTLTLSFSRSPAAPGGLQLEGWVAQDAQNNRTSVQLASQKYNMGVSDKLFTWRDPRPVTVKR